MQKAKRDDFRLEEELRTAKAKYEEANEDVFRRMQDIQDAEADSIRDLTNLLDIQLDYHERCAESLRQTRAAWPGDAGASPANSYGGSSRRPTERSRSNTAQSNSLGRTTTYDNSSHYAATPAYEEPDDMPSANQHMRVPIRSQSRISVASSSGARDRDRDRSPAAPAAPRPAIGRASTYAAGRTASAGGAGAGLTVVAAPPPQMPSQPNVPNVASLRGQLRPTGQRPAAMDVFGDDEDTDRSDTPPGSASPATSYSNSSRTNLNGHSGIAAGKKAPPPPPSRAKKPAPPVPNRREWSEN